MSRNSESTVETTNRGETTSLYYFTLQSHYQRSVEQHPAFYRPPDKGDVRCARNPEQLQWLMDHIDLNLFDEKDRESDGLILGIDPSRAFPLVESSSDQELPALIFAVPTQAVVEKVVVPRKEAGFRVPAALSIKSSLSLKQRLERAAESVLYALILASLLGLVLAAFPKIFPSESASQWLSYFWTNASFWVALLVSILAVTGFVYLLLGLSRSKVQEALKGGKLDLPGGILRIVGRLDPGPNVLATWVFFVLGVAFLTIAGLGISTWYLNTPLPPVEFRIQQSGQPPYPIHADGQVVLPPEAVVEIRVPLPPNVTRPSCRWSTAERTSRIYEQANCQAVYWAPNATGEDRVVVEVYQGDRRLTRASFTVSVQ